MRLTCIGWRQPRRSGIVEWHKWAYIASMPAVKAANPKTIFTPEDWAAITRVSNGHGIWLVVHGWLVVSLAAFGGAWAWNYHWLAGLLATPVVLAILGGRQLGLAILMHDAAHGLLHTNRRVNNWLGEWPSGASVGSDLQSYRAYHLTHHRFTQQPEDPDLGLSAPFPTSRASLWRKVVRDLTGQTFFKQRVAQFGFAWKGVRASLRGGFEGEAKRSTLAGTPFNKGAGATAGLSAPMTEGAAVAVAKTVGRFLGVQAILLAISLILWGWTPYLLWLVALATTFQLFLRIRNIAEHACTTTGSDDPFTHARTTHANWWERATVAPYWVNYHSEHHLFMGVPCYELAKAHALLGAGGYHSGMRIEPGYGQVLRLVTASPLV
jgi:fatty acid desaturase